MGSRPGRLDSLALQLSSDTVQIEADAFLIKDPIGFVVRSEDAAAGDPGGLAIASAFAGDRRKVAWAWSSMWTRAGEAVAPVGILLFTDQAHEPTDAALSRLKLQASERPRTRSNKKKQDSHSQASRVKVRPIKDLAEYDPDEGTIVNSGKSLGGIAFARNRDTASRRKKVKIGLPPMKPVRTRSVLPPQTDREQLAFDAVMRALRLNPPQIADLRDRRGIGADAMDELRQFFEVKMESGSDWPSEVTLYRSEVEAAEAEPDFFLAVVSGLEEAAGNLRVRFIFDPLERLTARIKGDVRLSGIGDVEALEFTFTKNEVG